MPRYAAFLRGVSPVNCKMPQLKRAFEAAGFEDVRTLLSSGNVLFDAPTGSSAALEGKAEDAMQQALGRPFMAFVRPVDEIRELLASDPYRSVKLAPGSKRVVTLMREPPKPAPKLPLERDGARVLRLQGRYLFSAYERSGKGPVFMVLIEKALGGKAQTTRTWETLEKMAR
jgi:uncharacterized protein (DUF1697 family)